MIFATKITFILENTIDIRMRVVNELSCSDFLRYIYNNLNI